MIGRLVTHPYQYLAGDPLAPYDTLNGLAATLFLIAIPFVWRQFGAGYGLFMLANLWLPLSSGVFEGLGRYCAVLFPVFIWLAGVRSREISTTRGRDLRDVLYAVPRAVHDAASAVLKQCRHEVTRARRR